MNHWPSVPLVLKGDALAIQYWTDPNHVLLSPESWQPLRCDHPCKFANEDATRCSHPVIIQRYQGVIAPAKCCDFFFPKQEVTP